MFRKVNLESKKELFLKSNHHKSNIRRKEKPIANKITNITNITISKNNEPKYNKIPSSKRYIKNKLHNGINPYNDKKNISKNNNISSSKKIKNIIFDEKKASVSQSKNTTKYYFRNFVNLNKYKNEYKIRRSQSLLCNRIYNKEYVLRTTNNSRIRKLFSMSSDIFNLDNCSTNLVQNSSFYSDSNYNFNSKSYTHLGNENNHKVKNIKYSIDYNNDINSNNDNSYFENKNLNNSLSKDLIEKRNVIPNLKRGKSININRIKNIDGKIKNRNYHKLSLLLNKDFSNTDFIPFLHKMQSKKKTNASNIESVNYDIISNKPNNLYDKYNKLSNIKANNSQYDNYEIIIPKNYNKLDSSKLKNILHAKGIHYYDFREQLNLIGDKGKFTFKVRKSNLDNNTKNNSKNMQLLSKKLKDIFSVKLKKYEENNKRKEVTNEKATIDNLKEKDKNKNKK